MVSIDETRPDSGAFEHSTKRVGEKQRGRQRRQSRVLQETALTIYVTMVLLFLAIPQSASDRLADFPSSALADGAKKAVAAVADIADLTGLPHLYESTRRGFLRAVGLDRRHRSRS